MFSKVFVLLTTVALVGGATLPPKDQRADKVIDLNTKRTFPKYESADAWRSRAQEIRQNILVSCGLWPMPEKTPLNPVISNRVERDGYSVENVYIETLPGFYLAGNLYRPLGKGNGPFPGVLNPHGHWNNGRFADEKDGSIAARCIQFARMGMVSFTYDMIGYNDTTQLVHRKSLTAQTNLLWNISQFGIQTWNSIRALDFLESLPDVDKSKLACTGESGGGTQTFILGAIDTRLHAQAPIVMVSHQMQGGCVCENAPLLRVDQSNMEIAAVPAPRPQMIVSATGDWTRDVMTVEGPGIASAYALLNAKDAFAYRLYEAPHNYNQKTRESVYGWFAHWLQNANGIEPIPEQPYKKEPDAALRVFPDGKLPAKAITEEALVKLVIERAENVWDARLPKDRAGFERFRNSYGPVWQHVMQLRPIDRDDLVVEKKQPIRQGNYFSTRVVFGREGAGDRIEGVYYAPISPKPRAFVLAHAEGLRRYMNASDQPQGLASDLLAKGFPVFVMQPFLTGGVEAPVARNYFTNFFSSYNRTDIQQRVQDFATAIELVKSTFGRDDVFLAGEGRAGLWAALAAPLAGGVVADCAEIGALSDEALLAQDLFAPGLRLFHAFEGAAILAGPRPLLLHNTGAGFSADDLQQAAKIANSKLRLSEKALPARSVVEWVESL